MKIGGHNKHTEEWVRFAIPEYTLGRYLYSSGYSGVDALVEIKCVECGEVFTRSMTTIRHGKNIICPGCIEIAAQRKRVEKACKKIKHFNKPSFKELHIDYCKECGAAMVDIKTQLYCSETCKKRSLNRKKDNRLNSSNLVDKDITLQKLFLRDNGRCYICGRVCDYGSCHKQEGYFIVDDLYPTIEHIKPLSKGGKHSWDNVKLACFKCNTLKGSKLNYELQTR